MTSAAYQTTPTLLPGTVTTDFDGGVASAAVAPQILEGEGDPTNVVLGSIGSFYTDVLTGDVYSNPDGTKAGWVAVGGGNPMTTKGDIFGFSTTGDRVPVGSNGKVLTAKSSVALGVEWDVIPAPDLSAYSTTSQANALYDPIVKVPILATVADGDTFNFNAGRPYLLHLAADAATFTININKPADGAVVRFAFDHAIAAVTWNHVGVANPYVGAPAAIATGDAFAWIYDASGDKYWPYKG